MCDVCRNAFFDDKGEAIAHENQCQGGGDENFPYDETMFSSEGTMDGVLVGPKEDGSKSCASNITFSRVDVSNLLTLLNILVPS